MDDKMASVTIDLQVVLGSASKIKVTAVQAAFPGASLHTFDVGALASHVEHPS